MTCYHLNARLNPGLTPSWCPDCQKDVSYHAVLEGSRDWMRAEVERLNKGIYGSGIMPFTLMSIGAPIDQGRCPDGSEHIFDNGVDGGNYGHSFGPRCVKCRQFKIVGVAIGDISGTAAG